MTRVEDWQSQLYRFIVEKRDTRFSYGAWDCCLFVCDAIEAMTGKDPASWFRGKYSSRKQAAALVRKRVGTASIRKLTEHITGEQQMPEVPVLCARRGDLILLKRPSSYSLGLVALDGLNILVATRSGLESIPMSMAVKAWRV